MTGFTAAYVVQQMADFKSGARKDSARMNGIAKDVSDEEARQAAEWFAALKPAVSSQDQRTRSSEATYQQAKIAGPAAFSARMASSARLRAVAAGSSPAERANEPS